MEQPTCPTCGSVIDRSDAQGLCPTCLLGEGLRSHLESDPIRAAIEEKLKGQYRVVRLLGKGGMGAVYLARDLTLDREVAIKVVKTESNALEVHDRFRREAKTAARLSHPNIVPLHAFGETLGMPYFVMGYVRGESLAARLRRDGRLDEEQGRRVLAEIAAALDHAHRQGVVHRDVKPDNVLLDDESGRALLTDFGVARAMGTGELLTQAGSVVGTPHYMSPEQAAGRADVDGRSDIYSLGVMAYAMLAGRLPFEGRTAADVLRQHLTQDPPPLRTLAPALGDTVVQAVERCLAKDPLQRWPDARALQDAVGVSPSTAELPDALGEIDGAGLVLLGVACVATGLEVVQWLWMGQMDQPPQGFLFLVWTVIGSLLLVKRALPVRRAGFDWARIAWASFLQPKWWPFWYPRALRRPEDTQVWERLPARLRLQRWMRLATPVAALLGALLILMFESPRFHELSDWPWLRAAYMYPPPQGGVRPHPPLGSLVGTLGWTLVHAAGFLLARINERWLARLGLVEQDRRAVLHGPLPRRSFWSRTHIAALLAPAAHAAGRRGPDTPHDHHQAILRHAEHLAGPLRALGAQAAEASRQLLASIAETDREIAELARNLEPGEDQRLEAKIAALAPTAGSPDGSLPLRTLLQKQLDLVRGLSERIEEARERRNRRVEMLKTLSLHLASLRVQSREAEVGSLSDRVRALCDDIAGQGAALSAAASADRWTSELETLDARRDPPKGT